MEEEVLYGPRIRSQKEKDEIQEAAERLRAAVMSGEVYDPLLTKLMRKEMNGTSSGYDGDWTLEQNQYINSVFDMMDLDSGVNLINASVGSGKTTHFIETVEGESKAKDGYIVLVPLNSIRLSFEGDNDVFSTGICTWNQVETILRHGNKEYFSDKTLVIDEVHGFFLDYGYKANVINRLVASFPLFKSVIMMSGTATPDDFSGIEFNKVYRIYKPSMARKVITTIISSKINDLVLNHLNNSNRKTIVLYNDKAKCEALNELCIRSGLVVNADKKDDIEVNQLFTSGMMNIDILYGTYSIVEGLSIKNVLDEVDVVIVGDEHPARIEQFTNRFRNISQLKSVTHFVNRKEVTEVGLFNRNEVVADAKVMKELLQLTYESLKTDEAKYSFTSQYRKDIAGSFVYFHDEKFEVSFTAIDYAYSEHKTREYANDFNILSIELEKYDFIVKPLQFDEGDGESDKVIRDTAKKLQEAAQEAENEVIRDYLRDRIAGDVKAAQGGTELYNAVHESTEKLLKRGLRMSDLTSLLEGYVDDRSMFHRAHMDADFHPTGNTIREMIISKVAGKAKLDAFAIRDIADAIISKVLVEYFTGDQELMLKHPLWNKCVTSDGKRLVSNSSKGAKSIVERYITLGKGKNVKVNGNVVKMCEVIHLSLTGLHFDIPAFQPKQTAEHVEVRQSLDVFKEQLKQLRM